MKEASRANPNENSVITVLFDEPDLRADTLSEKDLALKRIVEQAVAGLVADLDCPAHRAAKHLTITIFGDWRAGDLSCDVEGCCPAFEEQALRALAKG
ncbi:MAG: hypothetical protein KIS66_02030 [Fimbriimonadaceae bacterium]|nr:hypothetical protein [Fimbriimonadaceae bacterium]